MSDKSGILYIVSTPIGNLGDFTPRAESVLKSVDLIAAEDTRHSRPLLQHFGISTPMTAYHEHNERHSLSRLLDRLEAGEHVALISDAGTPLISDPGFPLVRACHARGIRVVPVPGPSALISALSVSGMPTDRFVFEGFPARNSSARVAQFENLKQEVRTLIFYESSHRILHTLKDMLSVFGPDRHVVLARELTKTYETLLSAPLSELLGKVEVDDNQRRGEFVVLIQGAPQDASQGPSEEALRILKLLLEELPLKQAAALAARLSGEKRNPLYQQALAWRSEPD